LVFSSPALGMNGSSSDGCRRVLARQFVLELADRFEERQASMSPTVPPISTSTKSYRLA